MGESQRISFSTDQLLLLLKEEEEEEELE